jgi:phosphoribosyl-AMP cyclohydrolase
MKAKLSQPAPPVWTALTPTVKILRLWKSNLGPKWPKVVLLQMPDADHRDFLKDPVEYINKKGVFKPLRTHQVHFTSRSRRGSRRGSSAAKWLVVALKHPDTTSAAMSCEIQP